MFKGILEVILAFFKFGESTNKVIEKGLPSAKIQEEKFEIQKTTLETKEWRKLYNQIASHLQMHPKEDIDAYVNIVCDNLEEQQKEDIRTGLHLRFQNRAKGKFRL